MSVFAWARSAWGALKSQKKWWVLPIMFTLLFLLILVAFVKTSFLWSIYHKVF